MSEANLAHAERGSALAQTLQLLAGADAIGGGAAGHVAAFLEPGDRAVEALSSYSSVWAKSLAIRENSSSSISMPLRRRTSRSPSSVPDTSPPHHRLMLRVYEHLFVGSRSSAKLISVRHTRLHSRPPDTTPTPSSQSVSSSVANLE